MAVTWLHLSDLHVRADDSYDRVVVFRALINSIKRFRERDGRSPDFIFATGDIGFSGKAPEYLVVSDFFDQVLEAAGLNRTKLYVVPGNHDVDRAVGKQLVRQLSSRDEAEEYFHPNAPWLHLRHKMAPFIEWHNKYFSGVRTMPTNSTCGQVELLLHENAKIGLLPINTALFCQDDYDHERLFIGRRCVDVAVAQLNSLRADLKIAIMHHPVQELSIIERQHVRAALVDNLDVILTGHLHEAGFVSVGMWSSRNLWCAAGATYQTRDYPNTAYYATFDTDQVTIFPIRYEDAPRETWTVDPSVFSFASSLELSFPVPCPPGQVGFRILGHQTSEDPPTRLGERFKKRKRVRKRRRTN